MDYAIRFAAARRLPLVLNLSFGVGNEVEGQARIDAIIDSVLAAHPDIVFTISAGNDGPGLSTVGFPGSARRSISIGATLPSSFLPPDPASGSRDDQLAYFSSRGGELAKPDLVTPGVAYSTVPRWSTGKEIEQGTSMASPHAAGLAALLVSGLIQDKRSVGAAAIKQAYEWLRTDRKIPDIAVRAAQGSDLTAAGFHERGPTESSWTQRFELTGRGVTTGSYALKSDSPWTSAPGSVTLKDGRAAVDVR